MTTTAAGMEKIDIPVSIGIDFHKRYSVCCEVNSADRVIDRGRIDHSTTQLFVDL
jgi:hypothetical protein